jgi:hypothetical protein
MTARLQALDYFEVRFFSRPGSGLFHEIGGTLHFMRTHCAGTRRLFPMPDHGPVVVQRATRGQGFVL